MHKQFLSFLSFWPILDFKLQAQFLLPLPLISIFIFNLIVFIYLFIFIFCENK